MPETMKDMKLPKGIYLVYACATLPSGAQAVDMIQFHIDPPGETLSDSLLSAVPLMLGVLGVFGVAIGGIFFRRNRLLSRSVSGKGE